MEFVAKLASRVSPYIVQHIDSGESRSLLSRILDPAALILEPVEISNSASASAFGDDEESCWIFELKKEAHHELYIERNATPVVTDCPSFRDTPRSTASLASELA
mmetsp:Transcript_13803/g.24762  ORF Transcript_13803/g.24762 Transcript_13803/m.24762 type:complete len:105 (-) Transcript_13803:86-400(-)